MIVCAKLDKVRGPYDKTLCAPKAATAQWGFKRATHLVIVLEELVQEVHAFLGDQVGVF